MHVYTLTDLTGKRKDAQRRTVIIRWDVRRHTVVVTLLAAAASLVVAAPFSVIFGGYAFLVAPVVVIPASHFLFLEVQRKGLRVTRASSLMNRRRRQAGKFYINGSPFMSPVWVLHTPTVIDVVRDETHVGDPFADNTDPVAPKLALGRTSAPTMKRGHLAHELG